MPKTIIDHETTTTAINGQVVKTETLSSKRTYKGQEPPYIKMYIDDLMYLKDLPPRHGKALLALLSRCTYAEAHFDSDGMLVGSGMEIVLNGTLKKRIAQQLGLQDVRSLNNMLSDLVKTKVLYLKERGIYQPNPYLFGRGDWNAIEEIRMTVSYDDIRGKTISQVIAKYREDEDDGVQLELDTERGA